MTGDARPQLHEVEDRTWDGRLNVLAPAAREPPMSQTDNRPSVEPGDDLFVVTDSHAQEPAPVPPSRTG